MTLKIRTKAWSAIIDSIKWIVGLTRRMAAQKETMMAIVSSRQVVAKQGESSDSILKLVGAELGTVRGMLDGLGIKDAQLRVVIYIESGLKIKALVAADELRARLADPALEFCLFGTVNEFNAVYDFRNDAFKWNGNEIYLTPTEKLVLHKMRESMRIERKVTPEEAQAEKQALYRMRQKFGPRFPGF
jgi:hypothetical protein